jgi:N-methylhydantoinase B
MNAIELKLFSSRVSGICDEMGLVLGRTAFSPNIKDRLDFSCALFNADGELFAQAAHIPVHLGSMAFAMKFIISAVEWQVGDTLILNDPYLGGTHLPDVTLVSSVFVEDPEGINRLQGFVVNRAHHANIGCDSPGSMPVSSSLEEEGLLIPPTLLTRNGQLQAQAIELLGLDRQDCSEEDIQLNGDFAAQAGANELGVRRLQKLIVDMGVESYSNCITELNAYGERIAASVIAEIENGLYEFEDFLDDDGQGSTQIKLVLAMDVSSEKIELDFSESSAQVPGNMNCPESVVAAAVFYCFRCLMPEEAPACAGLFKRFIIKTRPGSIVNAQRPAAVAAGNVETSMRLVDVVFGALATALPDRIPAASQGTMNNVAMGYVGSDNEERWDYYETLAGGIGASPSMDGLDASHSHMTNTLNTPAESLEMHYPLRIRNYSILSESGGAGLHSGGNGLFREYEFLQQAKVSILSERRNNSPWGLKGGLEGSSGKNLLNGESVAAKSSFDVKAGDKLLIITPGGGGWGSPVED